MGILSAEKGRRVAKWIAVTGLLVVLGVTALILGAAYLGETPQGPIFLQSRHAAMDEQIMRIHRGRVDAAALARIQTDIVKIHQQALAKTVAAPDGGVPVAPNPRFLIRVANYLTFPDRPPHLEEAVWPSPRLTQMAQNAPIPAVQLPTPATSSPDNRFF